MVIKSDNANGIKSYEIGKILNRDSFVRKLCKLVPIMTVNDIEDHIDW